MIHPTSATTVQVCTCCLICFTVVRKEALKHTNVQKLESLLVINSNLEFTQDTNIYLKVG